MSWPPTLLSLMKRSGDVSRTFMVQRMPVLLKSLVVLRPTTIIKVAGTNGKGSTAAMLAAILKGRGHCVGLFTSPHLVHVGERIQVNGNPLPEAFLEREARAFEQELLSILSEHGQTLQPSFFETLILIALRCFAKKGVDVAILEAGIGGYRDALQFLPGTLSAITNVGLDHCDKLGSTLRQIGQDKAGIADAKGSLVLGPNIGEEARQAIVLDASPRAVRIIQAQELEGPIEDLCLDGFRFEIDDVSYRCPLAGAHQRQNLATALAMLRTLDENHLINPGDYGGLAHTNWPGRLQKLANGWVVDVAHNRPGLQALQHFLSSHKKEVGPIRLVYGAAADKDVASCLPYLPEATQRYVVGGFYRSLEPKALKALLTEPVTGCFDTITQALESLEKAPFEGTTLVTGSVFLAGEVIEAVQNRA